SAWRHGRVGDRVHTGLALTLYSVPSFWLGLLLIITLSVGIGPVPGLFPTGGMESGGEEGFAHVLDVAHHLVLPVVTLVAVEYGQTLLVTRSALLDEMGSDYLTTARAKGLRDDLVRRRHAVPNALLPTVTLIFINLGRTVAGVILVETVFSWPGLGGLFYQALSVPDLPLVQGLFFVFAAAVILMNTLADLIYPLLDPRVGRSRPTTTAPPVSRSRIPPPRPRRPPPPAGEHRLPAAGRRPGGHRPGSGGAPRWPASGGSTAPTGPVSAGWRRCCCSGCWRWPRRCWWAPTSTT